MAKYAVEISEDVSVELDVPPGAPALMRVELEWTALPHEADEILAKLGGREKFHFVGQHVLRRQKVPLTRDGEQVGVAQLEVWLLGEEAREQTRVMGVAGVRDAGA